MKVCDLSYFVYFVIFSLKVAFTSASPFFNPFNTAISTNTTDDGRTIWMLTYPKHIKKFTLGVSKEEVSETKIDFSSILSGIIKKFTGKFSGLFGSSAGLFGSLSGSKGGSSTESPDSDFDFTDDNSENIDESTEDTFTGGFEEESGGFSESSSIRSTGGYRYPTRSSTTLFQSYLPPPTPSVRYQLPRDDDFSDFS